jgi:hypothetical protein
MARVVRILKSRLVIAALLFACSAAGVFANAQEATEPIDVAGDAQFLGQVSIDPALGTRAALHVSSFGVGAGQSTLTLVTGGTSLLTVQSGTLLLVSDQPVGIGAFAGDGTAPVPLTADEIDPRGDGTGSAITKFADFPAGRRAHVFAIATGMSVTIGAGSHVRFVAGGGSAVQLLLINLAPV